MFLTQLLFLLSGLLFVALSLSSYFICKDKAMLQPMFQSLGSDLVLVNGKVVDSTRIKNPEIRAISSQFRGQDISNNFPSFVLLGRTNNSETYLDDRISACVGNRVDLADAWLRVGVNEQGFSAPNGNLVSCPNPDGSDGKCFIKVEDLSDVRDATLGSKSFHMSIEIFAHLLGIIIPRSSIENSDKSLVIIRGKVYDVGRYIAIANDKESRDGGSAFLGDAFTQAIAGNIAKDATESIEAIPDIDTTLNCMDLLFFAGLTEDGAAFQSCWIFDPVISGIGILLFIVILTKCFLVLFKKVKKSPDDTFSRVIVFINCYSERDKDVEKCLNSVAESTFPGKQILLYVVVDGHCVGNSGRNTTDHILRLLNHQGGQGKYCAYNSLGEGSRSLNIAQVFSGFFVERKNQHKIPYVVVSKCGNRREVEFQGNRGKRDSFLLLLTYISKICSRNFQLDPLEYEIYKNLSFNLGISLLDFDYILSLDGDCQVDKKAISELSGKMDLDQDALVIQGRSYITNSFQNPVTWISAYQTYVERTLNSSFESSWGTLSIASAEISIWRVRGVDGVYYCTNPLVIQMLSNDYIPPQTLHMKNVLLMGEEKFFGCILMKVFPGKRIKYDHAAICYKSIESGLFAFFKHQRKKFNSLLHMRYENYLMTSDFGIRIWSFMDVTSMFLSPGFWIYVYYALLTGILQTFSLSSFLVPALMVLAMLTSIIFGILRLRFDLLPLGLIHMVFSVPIFYILVPIISIMSSDNYTWPVSSKSKHKMLCRNHGCTDKNLDKSVNWALEGKVPELSLSDWQIAETQHGYNSDLSSVETPTCARPNNKKLSSVENYNNLTALNSPAKSENTFSSNGDIISLGAYRDFGNSDQESVSHSVSDLRPETLFTRKSFETQTKIEVPNAKQTMKQKQYRPTNFDENKSRPVPVESKQKRRTKNSDITMSPMRAVSVAPSEYQSDYAPSLLNRLSRKSLDSKTNTSIFDNQGMSTEELYARSGISKEEVREELNYLLHDCDLNQVTRSEIKIHLRSEFGPDVEIYDDFINVCIEEFTLDQLALL